MGVKPACILDAQKQEALYRCSATRCRAVWRGTGSGSYAAEAPAAFVSFLSQAGSRRPLSQLNHAVTRDPLQPFPGRDCKGHSCDSRQLAALQPSPGGYPR